MDTSHAKLKDSHTGRIRESEMVVRNRVAELSALWP